MAVILLEKTLVPYEELQRYQSKVAVQFGATASFVGTMRDFNDGAQVSAMTLEHYPGMTEKVLETILAEAANRWEFVDALIAHRVGVVSPGEPIVLVAVWSVHRGAAFDTCRFLMEMLKQKAPFWKQEALNERSLRWVERNTDGYRANEQPNSKIG